MQRQPQPRPRETYGQESKYQPPSRRDLPLDRTPSLAPGARDRRGNPRDPSDPGCIAATSRKCVRLTMPYTDA